MSAGRIALIEDNPDNRFVVRVMLEDVYDITDYETGPSALAAFERDVPDLILLDIALPGMDGTEVVGRIRRDPRLHAIPVIALTAHAMQGDRDRYIAAGCDDYVSKPIIDVDAFIATVDQHLRAGRPEGSCQPQ